MCSIYSKLKNMFAPQPLEVHAGDGDEEQRAALSLAQRPKFTVFGKNIDSGYLKHVYTGTYRLSSQLSQFAFISNIYRIYVR